MDLAMLMLETANDAHGVEFSLLRRLPGGYQTGAYELIAPDGQHAVLKWGPPRPADQVAEAGATIGAARAAGWPTPAWLYWGIGPDQFHYVIQGLVQGEHRPELDSGTLELLLGVNDLQAELDPPTTHGWSAWARDLVYADPQGILDGLAHFSHEGARYSSTVGAVRQRAGNIDLPARDLVCGVFSLENVLFGGSQVAAVVDACYVGRGTRAFDLAVLYSRLTDAEQESPVGRRLRSAAEQIVGSAGFSVCLAAELSGVLQFVMRRNPARFGELSLTAARTLERAMAA